MMEPSHENLSLRRQCELLSLNRSTVYYKPRALFDDTTLANEIYQLWHEMPFYGYRRMTAELRRRGHQVNGKRVLRLMKEMHLEALYPKPQTSLKGKKHKIYPYLLKDVEVAAPNEAWCTDITYLKLPSGFIYLVALIDIYSRYVLAWRLSNTMDTHFCVEMLEEALTISTPCILNTDQGSQFTSEAWVSCVGAIPKSCVWRGGSVSFWLNKLKEIRREEEYTTRTPWIKRFHQRCLDRNPEERSPEFVETSR